MVLTDADKEMTGERCGPRCKDWRLRATEVAAHVASIEAEIAALGPAKPVNPEARQMARLAALFGADETKATAVLTLVKPFLWTLFFEVGSIISLGFAFRPGTSRRVAANDNKTAPSARPAPTNGGTRAAIPENHPVIVALAEARRPLSNDELARKMGVSKGEASKRWREVESELSVTRDGRALKIALAS